jgi:hypothetical protein
MHILIRKLLGDDVSSTDGSKPLAYDLGVPGSNPFELCWIIGCGQVSFQVLRFSPVSAIPPMLLIHFAVTETASAWQLAASLNNTSHVIH